MDDPAAGGGEEPERPSAHGIDLSPTQPHSPRPTQAKATSSGGPAPAVLQEDINGPWTVTGGRHQRWRLGAT